MHAKLVVMQDEALRKVFGARLKGLRKQKGWAQKELAGRVGIRFQQLNKYESGLNTCLLYTSPSPRDRTRSRMPSSA